MAESQTSCPYVGPEPFSEKNANYFFGRELDVQIIASNLNTAPATVLYGPSGVGKSSVLRAAVVPYLKAQSTAAVAVFSGWNSSSFLADLKAECIRAVSESLGANFPADAGLPLDELLRLFGEAFDGRVLLIFDQFEEYLLYHSSSKSGLEFEIQLARAVNRRDVDAGFLFSLREDALSGLDRLRDRMPAVLANTLRLEHLDNAAAADAIRLPLEAYSKTRAAEEAVSIESGLVTAVLNQAQIEDEPGHVETALIQLVMERVWKEESPPRSRILRLSTFEQLGGAKAISRAYVDDVMNKLSPEEQQIASRIFVHLVTPTGAKIAQKTEDLAAHADYPVDKVRALLGALAAQRILCRIPRPERYEIFHDVLGRGILEWRARYLRKMAAREAEQRAAKRTRKIVGVMAALFVLSAILVSIWIVLERRKDRMMASRDLAADAINRLQTGDSSRGVSLALEAVALVSPPTIEAERALHLAVQDWSLRESLQAHTQAVTRITLSADGRLLATASRDHTVKVWDLSSRAGAVTLPGDAEIWSVAFSRSADLVAAGAADGTARIWNLETRKALFTLPAHQGRVSAVAFDPAGATLATAGADGMVQFWSVATGKSVRTAIPAHQQPVTAIAFNFDGSLLATASAEGIARVWNLSTGRATATLAGHLDQLSSIAFSPDGKRIATGSADGTARLWQTSSGEQMLIFSGHAETVSDVAFDRTGTRLATAGFDQTVRIWDIARGTQLFRLVHPDNVTSVIFDRAGVNLFSGSNGGTVRKWSEPFLISHQNDAIYGVAYSGDGTRIAVAGFNAQILDRTGRPLAPPMQHRGIVTAVAFSPDQKLIATAGLDGFARLWQDGSERLALKHDGQVTAVAFHPDGTRLATASFDQTARIWDTGTGREIQRIKDTGKLKDVAFSPDGKLLATACVDGVAKVWDWASGNARVVISGHEKIFSVAFDPEGKRIATGAQDGSLKLWDAATGAHLGSYYGHLGPIYRIAFSPDGSRFATAGSDGVIKVWQPGLATELFSLRGHTGPVFSIAFRPDGTEILSGGDDQSARLFPLKIDDLKAIARLRIPVK